MLISTDDQTTPTRTIGRKIHFATQISKGVAGLGMIGGILQPNETGKPAGRLWALPTFAERPR
jgi:hypothetical protein